MSKESVKNLIDMIPDEDIDTIYKVLIRFIPEVEPFEDEIETIKEYQHEKSDGVDFNSIDWDW